VGVVTTIEGAWKAELQARCVEVVYEINGTHVDSDRIEDEILKHRNDILSAMVAVLQAWLRLHGTKQFWAQCPRREFERHLTTLAELLYAYQEVSGKPEPWAEMIIAEWVHHLSQNGTDIEAEDDLEFPIIQTLPQCTLAGESVTFEGKSGTLYVTESGPLLAALKHQFPKDIPLPKNPTGLGRRLRSARFRTLKFLDGDIAPQFPQLRRTTNRRPIGFFIPNESNGEADNSYGP
jgi:hypothetical protein